MLYYVIFLLGTTAHAHNCITKFVSFQRADSPLSCASARHVRTAHKLAADSTGASHRLAPVLDPNHVSGRIFFVLNQTLRPAIMFVLNVLHRPDDFIASTQPWYGCFREFCRVIEFLETFYKLRRVAAAAGQTLGHVIQSVHCDYVVAKPNLFVCFKLVKKGYKTNIPSFYFERIVEITYLRRTGNFSIFPRGFAPRKNRNMPVLLRYIISTILSQNLVYLYIINTCIIIISITKELLQT